MARKKSRTESDHFRSRTALWMVRLATLIAVLAPLVALIIQWARLHPFVDDVNFANSAGDDWLTYKRMALEILDKGITIPSIQHNYTRPGGFLYGYFIALIFQLFGRNAAYVYVVQGVLAGAVVPAIHFTYRKFLSPLVQLALVISLALLMYFDVSRWYTQKLLSENLLIFLVPFVLLTCLLAWERKGGWLCFAAGAVAGLAVLTRPNVLLVPFGLALLLAVYCEERPVTRRIGPALAYLLGFVASQLPLVVRNVVSGGAFRAGMFSPVFEKTNDWAYASSVPLTRAFHHYGVGSFWYYKDRFLYILGFAGGEFVLHWLLMWVGVVLLLLMKWKGRSFPFWQACAVAFCFLYFGPLAVTGGIRTYGARMILPGTPVLLLLAMSAAGELIAPLPDQEPATSTRGARSATKGRRKGTAQAAL